jgi:hypothetical protein
MKTTELQQLSYPDLVTYAEWLAEDGDIWRVVGDNNLYQMRLEQMDTVLRVCQEKGYVK